MIFTSENLLGMIGYCFVQSNKNEFSLNFTINVYNRIETELLRYVQFTSTVKGRNILEVIHNYPNLFKIKGNMINPNCCSFELCSTDDTDYKKLFNKNMSDNINNLILSLIKNMIN